MALKPDRVILETDIRRTCPTAATRGVVLVRTTSGSGVALGDSAGVADLKADPSGYKVAGVLLNDMVSIDETRYHKNFHKDEMPLGGRCTLLTKGRVTTNAVTGTPTEGAVAYLTANGNVTPTVSATGGTAATPKVGKFGSIKDANGYVDLEVNLPIAE